MEQVPDKSGPRENKWSEAECLEALRQYDAACKNADSTPKRNDYQEWQKSFDAFPSVTTIERFAPWSVMRYRAAVADGNDATAELLHDRIGKPGPVKKWNEPEIHEILLAYKASCDKDQRRPSRSGYQRWHQAHQGTPSITTVDTVRPWSDLLQEILSVPD